MEGLTTKNIGIHLIRDCIVIYDSSSRRLLAVLKTRKVQVSILAVMNPYLPHRLVLIVRKVFMYRFLPLDIGPVLIIRVSLLNFEIF